MRIVDGVGFKHNRSAVSAVDAVYGRSFLPLEFQKHGVVHTST